MENDVYGDVDCSSMLLAPKIGVWRLGVFRLAQEIQLLKC